MLIILPIPDSKLSANKSYGKRWGATYSLKNNAKKTGYYLAREATYNSVDYFTADCQLSLRINAIYENERHLDDDNLLSALKSYRDGIFQYLETQVKGINDRQITLTILETSHRDKNHPRIQWELMRR